MTASPAAKVKTQEATPLSGRHAPVLCLRLCRRLCFHLRLCLYGRGCESECGCEYECDCEC
eukprot:6202652-Pleurochrysis_carterae.AAC.3